MPHIKINILFLKYRPKLFIILITYCKIHAIIFFFKIQNMPKYFRFFLKKYLNNFRIFSRMQEEEKIYFYIF